VHSKNVITQLQGIDPANVHSPAPIFEFLERECAAEFEVR
jgi:hypothetical protein